MTISEQSTPMITLSSNHNKSLPTCPGDVIERQRQYLPTNCIEVGPGRRDANLEFVVQLALSVQETGLIYPITVRPSNVEGRYELVAGLQRLEAVRSLGSEFIEADVICDDISGELAQFDENLFRKELSPAELAEAVGRRDLALTRLARGDDTQISPKFWGNRPSESAAHPSGSLAARGRKRNPNSDRALAQLSGWSEETIRKSRRRVEVLGLALLTDIKGTDLDSNSELDALCALLEPERLMVVSEAKRQACSPPSERIRVSAKARGQIVSTPRERLMRAWRSASDKDQEWFLEVIARGDQC